MDCRYSQKVQSWVMSGDENCKCILLVTISILPCARTSIMLTSWPIRILSLASSSKFFV